MQEIAKKALPVSKPKTLALALSGCGGRAVTYIGMLEVLEEHHIPIASIAACSSASLVACSYGSGTMQNLKEQALSLSSKELFDMFETSFKSGLLSLDAVDDVYGKFITVDNLEELSVPVAVVASDLLEGKAVVFRMGDIMRAIKASCSMPGLFEPVVWGGKVLVDGGLFSIVPVEVARESGADIIVGVDMAVSRNLFKSNVLNLKNGYNHFKKPFSMLRGYAFGPTVIAERSLEESLIDNVNVPNLGSVLGRAMDYAIEERKKGEHHYCDLMLEPDVKKIGKADTSSFELMYQIGRKTMEDAMPRLKILLEIND